MPDSGKTSFVYALQNKLEEKTSHTKEITKVKIDKRKIDDKNYRITIHDTSGAKNQHVQNVMSLIKGMDLILFFCSAKDYIDNIEYRKLVNARLKHINSVIANEGISRAEFLIVLTISDIDSTKNLSKEEKKDMALLEKKIKSLFVDKEYGDYQRFFLNVYDKESVENLLAYIPLLFPFYHKVI